MNITLSPLVIFKNLIKAPKVNFPGVMVVEVIKGGMILRTVMKDRYAPELWKRRPYSGTLNLF